MLLTRPSFRDGRFIAILTIATWLVIEAGFVNSVIKLQSQSYYSYLLALLALVGICGGVLYFANFKLWRFIVGIAGGLYLAVFCFQILVSSPYFERDDLSLLQALGNGFFYRWKAIEYLFLNHRYLDGLVFSFYEWFMPIVQCVAVLLLVRPLTLRSTGNRE